MVSELIDTTSATWKEDVIRETFTRFDADEILKIPLCTRQVDDFWAWMRKREVLSVYGPLTVWCYALNLSVRRG